MLQDFKGRVAVITGGGSGIGAALARACAAEGMKVALADVDLARAQSVASELGEGAFAVKVDVADPASVESFAARVEEALGTPDLLCNNAGVSPLGLLWEFKPEDWTWLIGVNVLGVVNCIRSFVPRMIAAGRGGHIVNTASSAALNSEARLGAYCATKHAVLGLSDSLRQDCAPYNIGVSVLCPGGVNTNISQTLTRKSSTDPMKDLTADLEVFMASTDPSLGVTIEPAVVASLVIRGVKDNAPYIMTAPGLKPVVAKRYNAILNAFDVARRIDASLP